MGQALGKVSAKLIVSLRHLFPDPRLSRKNITTRRKYLFKAS